MVEPKLLTLENRTKREQKTLARKALYHSMFAMIVAGLGLVGALTQQVGLALVGGAMATSLLNDLADVRNSKEPQPDDFYFLLRLKQLSEKKRQR